VRGNDYDKLRPDLVACAGVSNTRAGEIIAVLKFIGEAPVVLGEYEAMLEISDKLCEKGHDARVTFPPSRNVNEHTPFSRWCDGVTTTEQFEKEHAIWGDRSVPERCR